MKKTTNTIDQINQINWVDSHCHLDQLNVDIYPNGLQDALQQAQQQGVQSFLCVSIDLHKLEAMMAATSSLTNNIFYSAGTHPLTQINTNWPAKTIDKLITSCAQKPNIVAIGETGLDFHYNTVAREDQLTRFAAHIEAAKACKKPLIIHTRSAKQETLDLLKALEARQVGGVLHCFTEDWDMAKKALDMNFYISISGIVTFPKAKQVHEAAKKTPLERLLIETDAPYLAPVPHRGQSNEPKYLPYIGACIAGLRNISQATLASATSRNFYNLFDSVKNLIETKT